MGIDKEGRKRLKIEPNALRELYLYSGNQCAFPSCNAQLLLDDGTLNGEIAHICGVGVDAARGKHNLSNEELREVSNLLILCQKHHAVIDYKPNEEKYPVQVLQMMKKNHEDKFRSAVAGLDRAEDLSIADRARSRRPRLLSALYGELSQEELVQSLNEIERFCDVIESQAPALRDVIALILAHGAPTMHRGQRFACRVGVSAVQLSGVTNLSESDLVSRVRHLEAAGIVDIDNDEGLTVLVLRDPTADITGMDCFAELQRIGGKAGSAQAIRDLDFTLFD